MKNKICFLTIGFLLFAFVFPLAAQNGGMSVAKASFLQGANAFKEGEWSSAVFMLRRAMSYPENNNADTLYMLIAAQMYSGEYKSAYQDCELFLQMFTESPYVSYVSYQRGRALYCLGEYDHAILVLSDFCHFYPKNEMYASALFWIAESFFATYNYGDANILYTRVVNEFPNDAKSPVAQYRLESIAQSAREEKLLYLLKETGEEYLTVREEYERQIMLSEADGTADIRNRYLELQHKNSELSQRVIELEQANSNLSEQLNDEKIKNISKKSLNEDMILELKQKAMYTQELLNSVKSNKEGK